MQKIGGLRQTGSAWNDGEILTCFEGFRVYGQLIWMNIWLDFAFLGIVVMCFWWLDWLDLEFWDLWSCIFRVLIDLIWSLGIYSQKFTGFFWLYLGFLDLQSTDIEILQYEVNLSLCFVGLFWCFEIYSQLKPAVCVTSPGFAFTMRHHPPYHRAFPVWRKPLIF